MNKNDLPSTLINEQEVKDYAEEYDLYYTKTSAKTGENIEVIVVFMRLFSRRYAI